jgi:hypothetical protein
MTRVLKKHSAVIEEALSRQHSAFSPWTLAFPQHEDGGKKGLAAALLPGIT